MGYRKSNKKVRDKIVWKAFCRENHELIVRIGLTLPTFETQERFEDFLMHGHIDHHDDCTNYTASEMSPEQYELFKTLVDKYFAAGFHDPGLMAVEHEERIRLAHKYPKQFGGWLSKDKENDNADA